MKLKLVVSALLISTSVFAVDRKQGSCNHTYYVGDSNYACWYGTEGSDVIEVLNPDAVIRINGTNVGAYNPEITNVFYAYAGNDLVVTGIGNDIIEAGNGQDVMIGRDGDDVMYGEERNPKIKQDGALDKFSKDEGTLLLPDYQIGEYVGNYPAYSKR